jgi:hypothetical protein
MFQLYATVLSASLAVATFGCEEHGHEHGPNGEHLDSAKTSTAKAMGNDHGHAHGPNGEHAPSKGELGKVTVSGFTFTVMQTSTLTPGKEADFALVMSGEGEPKAVRLWIGKESGEGSVKVKTHKHGSKMEAHVEVPSPLPDDAKLWIEVETAEGRKAASVDLKR